MNVPEYAHDMDTEYFCDNCNHKVSWEELYQDRYGFPTLCPNCYLNLFDAHQAGGWYDLRPHFSGNSKPKKVHYFKNAVSLCDRQTLEGIYPEYEGENRHWAIHCKRCTTILRKEL